MQHTPEPFKRLHCCLHFSVKKACTLSALKQWEMLFPLSTPLPVYSNLPACVIFAYSIFVLDLWSCRMNRVCICFPISPWFLQSLSPAHPFKFEGRLDQAHNSSVLDLWSCRLNTVCIHFPWPLSLGDLSILHSKLAHANARSLTSPLCALH